MTPSMRSRDLLSVDMADHSLDRCKAPRNRALDPALCGLTSVGDGSPLGSPVIEGQVRIGPNGPKRKVAHSQTASPTKTSSITLSTYG
jgi:hypothetical protein